MKIYKLHLGNSTLRLISILTVFLFNLIFFNLNISLFESELLAFCTLIFSLIVLYQKNQLSILLIYFLSILIFLLIQPVCHLFGIFQFPPQNQILLLAGITDSVRDSELAFSIRLISFHITFCLIGWFLASKYSFTRSRPIPFVPIPSRHSAFKIQLSFFQRIAFVLLLGMIAYSLFILSSSIQFSYVEAVHSVLLKFRCI